MRTFGPGIVVVVSLLGGCGAKRTPVGSMSAAEDSIRVTRVDVPPVVPTPFSEAQRRFANLDFELLSHPELAPHVRDFMEAVRAIAEGRPDAVERVDALLDAEDDGVRQLARQIRNQLHYDAGTFTALRDQFAAWGQDPDPYVVALAGLPTPRFESRQPVADVLERAAFDLPALQLEANGTSVSWVWDTGADFTLLPRSVAEGLGVVMQGDEVQMGTSTSQDATTRFGVLKRLDVGGVTVHDLPVLVLPDENLRWEVERGEFLELHGVLGWNVIRRTRSVLDYRGGRYTMTLSEPEEVPERNFFWLGYPILRLRGVEGQPLTFGYDSGSDTTDLKPNFETKVPLGKVRRRRVATAGAGGVEVRRSRKAQSVSFVLAGHRFDLPEVVVSESPDDTPFVLLDGVIGSDIAQTCVVTLDAMNGFYGMQCP